MLISFLNGLPPLENRTNLGVIVHHTLRQSDNSSTKMLRSSTYNSTVGSLQLAEDDTAVRYEMPQLSSSHSNDRDFCSPLSSQGYCPYPGSGGSKCEACKECVHEQECTGGTFEGHYATGYFSNLMRLASFHRFLPIGCHPFTFGVVGYLQVGHR